MNKKRALLACLLVAISCLALEKIVSAKRSQRDSSMLAAALLEEDLTLIRAAVSTERTRLGEAAGIPEIADSYVKPPSGAKLLSRNEAQLGFSKDLERLKERCWWKIGMDPANMTAPLREPASVLIGCIACVRAELDDAARCLELAKDTADFLMWAQEQAGAGLFPFPAARGDSDARSMQAAARFLANAEKAGKLDSVARNGWAFDDLSDGGLQFDNGECGLALLGLYQITKDPLYLASARKAADWCLDRPLCPNWNYNSFSVQLLAKTFAITGEEKYLEAATRKAILGVIPGQLVDGPRSGRWMDAHNARPAYHYIMLRALAQLAAVMPPSHENRREIMSALALGLTSRNAEMITQGVMNKESAIDALVLVNQAFRDDTDFLRSTHSQEALNTLSLLISAEAHRGKKPLTPGGWGLFLEHITTHPTPP